MAVDAPGSQTDERLQREAATISKTGDKIENPVTGQRAVVRIGTENSGGELLVADLYLPPGTASTLADEHYHPTAEEYLTVIRGLVGFRLDGVESVAGAGERVEVPPRTLHQWWNAGREESHVIVEIRPAEGFEEMVISLFGLARQGKTDFRGMPRAGELPLFARKFESVVVFAGAPQPSPSLLEK